MKNSFIWPLRREQLPSRATATSVAVVPSTSGWLPPTNTPTVPSSAGIWVVCTYLVDLADDLVALVQQVVGRLAVASGARRSAR